MEFISRFKNALFLLLVLLAQAIALAIQVRSPLDPANPDGPNVLLIRRWAAAAITPFERGAHATGYTIRHGWSNYLDLRHVRQQNRELQQQLTQLRIEQAALAEDAIQGRRLQALLGFREKYVVSTIAAQVIGASGSDQSHVLTIDKGSNSGLKPDMAVITPDGIVGKLRDVFPTTAQVLEIDDQTSGAGVTLETTRMRAILRGTTAGRLEINNLTADSRIRPGEKVLTSGGDQIFPRGLPVGTIERIAPDPDHQPYSAIVIKPAVNLSRVEEVLIITGTQSDLPAGAQQDLNAAAAQHAADISAERLPGLHDPGAANSPTNATDGKAPLPATAAPSVPKPLPVNHPDRFSSGTTPPAEDLRPGAAHTPPATPAPAETSRPAPQRPASVPPQ
jgi:rod shape-determining protein MreC